MKKETKENIKGLCLSILGIIIVIAVGFTFVSPVAVKEDAVDMSAMSPIPPLGILLTFGLILVFFLGLIVYVKIPSKKQQCKNNNHTEVKQK